MSFRPRIGDVLIAVLALLLVLAVANRAATYSHRRASARTHVVHRHTAKAARWPRRA